jgi:poly(glycerol-phosphate) alpha-glucosyltransferase
MGGQFDLAYCAALWKYPSWAVLNWQKKTNKPIVVAPHGSLDAWALNNSRWKKRLASWLFKQEQLERATCFRALCTAEADAIRSYGLKQRIEIIPNGVELPEGSFKFQDLSLQAQGKKMLLFLGRIHPKKGLVNALRAWAEIRNSPSAIRDSAEWQFVIAGWDQGGHEAELKALCAELGLRTAMGFAHGGTESTEGQNLKLNSYKLKTPSPEAEDADILFFGPAFGEEKEALFRSADALILPSFSEGLPMSVLEAWAYGLPVVMTPECNLPEGFASHAALEIRSGEGGRQGSDFSFQQGLRTLLEIADQERSAMGMRGRRLVEAKFTWQKVAAQMRALYEDILPG